MEKTTRKPQPMIFGICPRRSITGSIPFRGASSSRCTSVREYQPSSFSRLMCPFMNIPGKNRFPQRDHAKTRELQLPHRCSPSKLGRGAPHAGHSASSPRPTTRWSVCVRISKYRPGPIRISSVKVPSGIRSMACSPMGNSLALPQALQVRWMGIVSGTVTKFLQDGHSSSSKLLGFEATAAMLLTHVPNAEKPRSRAPCRWRDSMVVGSVV